MKMKPKLNSRQSDSSLNRRQFLGKAGKGALLTAATPSELPQQLFREDLYRDALQTNQTHEAIS